jgi:hypothetical protein
MYARNDGVELTIPANQLPLFLARRLAIVARQGLPSTLPSGGHLGNFLGWVSGD